MLETKNKFVRFHALQSVHAFVVLSVILSILQAFFGELGFLAYFILNLNPALIIYLFISAPSDIFSSFFGGVFMLSGIPILLWLFLIYQAFRGKKFSLPLIGDLVDKVLESIYSE